MNPRRYTAPDGTYCWDRWSMLRAGYGETGVVVTDDEVTMAGHQELAHRLGVTMASLTAVRIALGAWEYFYALEVTKTDKMEALLPA